jgi:hypothetical protein
MEAFGLRERRGSRTALFWRLVSIPCFFGQRCIDLRHVEVSTRRWSNPNHNITHVCQMMVVDARNICNHFGFLEVVIVGRLNESDSLSNPPACHVFSYAE